jgi:hypothetical protein
VDRLRKFTKLPIALGFGISNAEHVRAVAGFADAAVVGSAIVALIEKTPAAEAAAAVGKFVAELRGSEFVAASKEDTPPFRDEATKGWATQSLGGSKA